MNKPKFSRKAVLGTKGDVDNTTPSVGKFIRSNQDNTLFPNIQIKDYKHLLTEDCVNYIDADGLAFKVSSSVEEDYIEVTNINTNEVKEYKNISEFKGKTKAIALDSVLGLINLKMEAKGEEPYSLDDFTIDKKKRLKFENGATIDGVEFKDSLSVAKHYLSQWVDAIKIQTQIPKVLLTIGSGHCHRNFLDLPEDYKSNRSGGVRPLLLKEIRKHILEDYPSNEPPELWEVDEYCDMMAFEHYIKYRKTGRITGIKTSPDKDAKCTAGFLFDPTKTFHFNQPQIWLIEASDKTVGELELAKSGMKFTGLMGTAYQCTISDTSDHYGSRLTMPAEMKPNVLYGDVAFYKDFINLTTPKEVLQKMVDKFYDFYPNGVQFKSHLGNTIDEDTLWWLQQVFSCQYMLRTPKDKADISKLLKSFKVDTSKIVGNNKYTPPVKTYIGCEDNINETEELITSILKEDLRGLKSMKKADQAIVLDCIKEKLESISFESHYEMQQTLKEGFTEEDTV